MMSDKIQHMRGLVVTLRDHILLGLSVVGAPHDCDHEGCPGRENKRKLEAAENVVIYARSLIRSADVTGGSERQVPRVDVDLLRAAIARWEGR